MPTDHRPDARGLDVDSAALDAVLGFLRRTHLSAPSDLAAIVAEEGERLGAHDVGVYLADLDQEVLIPLPGAGGRDEGPLSIAGTVAGRSFTGSTILRTPEEQEGERLWLPLLDGTERLGVIALSFPAGRVTERLVAVCERFSHLVALTVVTKADYGDVFDIIRRRRPMTIASELSSALAPPLTFATDDLALAGMLEPCYDNGGDALDYAVNDRVLHVGIFDAMGHGLAAAGVAAFAVSAYRRSRRTGAGLLETYEAMDEAVGSQFPGERFVTAVIAELDLDSGALRWISAGHPAPLVLRGGRRVRRLESHGATPLGIGVDSGPPEVGHESLEPRDMLLLYTDGLVEARTPSGELFTEERLVEFIEREAAAGLTTPETLRRLRLAILGRARSELRDDASALLVEWRRGAEQRLPPQTVVE